MSYRIMFYNSWIFYIVNFQYVEVYYFRKAEDWNNALLNLFEYKLVLSYYNG